MLKYVLLAAVMVLPHSERVDAQQIQINKENKTIAITTSDDASMLADVAKISIGFNTYGKDQDATYADATRISNDIIKALLDAQVKKEQIESNTQSLSPLSPGNDEDKVRYGQGLRFEFTQRWTVTVSAAQAADVLHLAVIHGANNSGGIQWEIRDDNALQAEAAAKALTHAHEIAKKMADGLGAKLGGLVYASNQSPPRGTFAGMGFGNVLLETQSASVSVMKRNLKPLAISPERITKSATVYAVFAIE